MNAILSAALLVVFAPSPVDEGDVAASDGPSIHVLARVPAPKDPESMRFSLEAFVARADEPREPWIEGNLFWPAGGWDAAAFDSRTGAIVRRELPEPWEPPGLHPSDVLPMPDRNGDGVADLVRLRQAGQWYSRGPKLTLVGVSGGDGAELETLSFFDESLKAEGWRAFGLPGPRSREHDAFAVVGPLLSRSSPFQELVAYRWTEPDGFDALARLDLGARRTRAHVALGVAIADEARTVGIVLDIESEGLGVAKWSFPALELQWSRDVRTKPSPWHGKAAAAALSDLDGGGERDLVVAWSAPATELVDGDGEPLVALSAEKGGELWRSRGLFGRGTELRGLCDVTGDGRDDVLVVADGERECYRLVVLDGASGAVAAEWTPGEADLGPASDVLVALLPGGANQDERDERARVALTTGGGRELWLLEIAR